MNMIKCAFHLNLTYLCTKYTGKVTWHSPKLNRSLKTVTYQNDIKITFKNCYITYYKIKNSNVTLKYKRSSRCYKQILS